MGGVRLQWDGKAAEVPQLRLPLQVVETVNAAHSGRHHGNGWRNKLIWGDNLHVLASLADELAGQVDLIYITRLRRTWDLHHPDQDHRHLRNDTTTAAQVSVT